MTRFMSKIEKADNGCLEWIGAKRRGYGAMTIKGVVVSSHRISFELFNGSISNNLLICHTCDNKACVNPAHLWLGTQKDNMKDASCKGFLDGIHTGKKFSDKAKRNMSAAKIGIKNPFYGKKHSEETKQVISKHIEMAWEKRKNCQIE